MSTTTPTLVATDQIAPRPVMGTAVRHLLTAAHTGGRFALVELTGPAEAGVPPHVHDREDETFLVLEGEVELYLDGGRRRALPGGVAHLPTGCIHGFRFVVPSRVYVLATPAGIEAMFEEISRLEESRPAPPDPAEVAAICANYGIRFVSTMMPEGV